MLTTEEKRNVEERVAATIKEEQHLRELRDYENRLLKEKRDKAEAERYKGDVVFGSKVAIAISGLIFIIVSYLIFNTLAIDLDTSSDIGTYFAFVGLAFAILAFRTLYIWEPRESPNFQMTGRRRGSRILAVAMLVETCLFSLLGGYLHCPHDFAHARYNAGDPEFNEYTRRNSASKFEPKPVKFCRAIDDGTWMDSWLSRACAHYYEWKQAMTVMVSIGLSISVICLLVSSKLKDEVHT